VVDVVPTVVGTFVRTKFVFDESDVEGELLIEFDDNDDAEEVEVEAEAEAKAGAEAEVKRYTQESFPSLPFP